MPCSKGFEINGDWPCLSDRIGDPDFARVSPAPGDDIAGSRAMASPVSSIWAASLALTATPKSRTSCAASRSFAESMRKKASAALSPNRSEGTAAASAPGTNWINAF